MTLDAPRFRRHGDRLYGTDGSIWAVEADTFRGEVVETVRMLYPPHRYGWEITEVIARRLRRAAA